MNDRVTLKESVGKAISYGIAPGTADRIGALAHCGRLGMILWHWKYGGESRGLEAENLLTTRSAKRFRVRYVGTQKQTYLRIRLAARQVLAEWYLPECRTCLGVKEITGEHKRVICPDCRGDGNKRFSDEERAVKLGVSTDEYKKIWDKRFRDMRDMIGGEDGMTATIIRDQLKTLDTV